MVKFRRVPLFTHVVVALFFLDVYIIILLSFSRTASEMPVYVLRVSIMWSLLCCRDVCRWCKQKFPLVSIFAKLLLNMPSSHFPQFHIDGSVLYVVVCDTTSTRCERTDESPTETVLIA